MKDKVHRTLEEKGILEDPRRILEPPTASFHQQITRHAFFAVKAHVTSRPRPLRPAPSWQDMRSQLPASRLTGRLSCSRRQRSIRRQRTRACVLLPRAATEEEKKPFPSIYVLLWRSLNLVERIRGVPVPMGCWFSARVKDEATRRATYSLFSFPVRRFPKQKLSIAFSCEANLVILLDKSLRLPFRVQELPPIHI